MKQLCLALITIAAVSCSTTPSVENKGKDQEIQILPPNIRVEKYKETFNMKAEGPVVTDCSGKPCTPEQLDGLKPDQIKKFKKNGAWKEYQEKEDSSTKRKSAFLLERENTRTIKGKVLGKLFTKPEKFCVTLLMWPV